MSTTKNFSASAPVFVSASHAGAPGNASHTSAINIDDIFGDCFFTPQGDTVFMDSQRNYSNAITSADNDSLQVDSKMGFVTGIAKGKAAPQAPQGANGKGKKRARTQERKMSEQQKVERRERNREHAKRSRIRKKFLLESLQQSVTMLKEENDKLKHAIKTHLGENVDETLTDGTSGLIADNPAAADKVLDDPDFSFIKALQTAQQNFVVTDPSLPDNPIVYATQGFLDLTGYTLSQVLGRNCRFLQGPDTDPKSVEKIRKSIEQGNDMSVCLLNYRVDGSTFWNQFFIAALRDAAGCITNYVGVQCKVTETYARNVCEKQRRDDEEDKEE